MGEKQKKKIKCLEKSNNRVVIGSLHCLLPCLLACFFLLLLLLFLLLVVVLLALAFNFYTLQSTYLHTFCVEEEELGEKKNQVIFEEYRKRLAFSLLLPIFSFFFLFGGGCGCGGGGGGGRERKGKGMWVCIWSFNSFGL